jgi:hypothetical protein
MVVGQLRILTMAMVWIALFRARSPPRLSRWRTVRPKMVYRFQIRPVLEDGATAMNEIFPRRVNPDSGPLASKEDRSSGERKSE